MALRGADSGPQPSDPRGFALSIAKRHDYRKWLGPMASVIVLALALVVLARITHALRLKDILDQFYSISWSTLLVSGALAFWVRRRHHFRRFTA